ncbi:MAG: hypothetical protein KDA37_06505, partial [Planctomycetales bacterium]|nr:hypothetical protein [Planctomycetales bacterium]
MPPTSHNHAVCLGCGCLCDDVQLSLSAGKISAPQLSCERGQAWFHSLELTGAAPDPSELDRAAKLLTDARMPLVCGLKHACTKSQRLAVEIADRLGGCVDWTTSEADAAEVIAMQTLGGVSASLGEVAQRADLVVFWRCDPAATHPRHLARFSLEPTSPWLPDGRADRQAVLIGDHRWETGNHVDLVIESEPTDDLSAVARVRACLAGVALEDDEPSVWAALADRIRHSRSSAIFYDTPLKDQGHAVLEQLTHLAQEVQRHTR